MVGSCVLGARAYNGGRAEPPAGSRHRAPGHWIRGKLPLEAENILFSEIQFCPFLPFCKLLKYNFERITLRFCRWSVYGFLFDFNKNYVFIVYRFRVIASFFGRTSPTLTSPAAFYAPVGVTPFEFYRDLRHPKTRVPALSCGVVCVILCLAVLIQ